MGQMYTRLAGIRSIAIVELMSRHRTAAAPLDSVRGALVPPDAIGSSSVRVRPGRLAPPTALWVYSRRCRPTAVGETTAGIRPPWLRRVLSQRALPSNQLRLSPVPTNWSGRDRRQKSAPQRHPNRDL